MTIEVVGENTVIESAPTGARAAFAESQRLANDPNVCAVGHGVKFRRGSFFAGDALVFYVRKKLHSSSEIEELGSAPIPETLHGFPTDVVEIGELAVAAADRALPTGRRGTRIDDPLLGGGATMALGTAPAGPAGFGTIGGVCFNATSSEPLVISNAHVFGQTLGAEVVQPVAPTAMWGAKASLASTGTPARAVLTRVPAALVAPVTFANAMAAADLILGGDTDPLTFGQGATPGLPDARTDSESVSVRAPSFGAAPAGKRNSPAIAWEYQRFASGGIRRATSNATRSSSKLLLARRAFTNAATYTSAQAVQLYAEIIPAAAAPASASAHFVLAMAYPIVAGDRVVPRLLRPVARQTPTAVVTSFQGFPAPARVGQVVLPVFNGAFAVDSDSPGTFQAGAGLPTGTLVLLLPSSAVRVFLPTSTQVDVDIDLRSSPGPLVVEGFNSAGDSVATITTSAGPSGRTKITAAGSEIVEVRLSGAVGAVLFGVTSRKASPETTAPLCYAGTINASELGSGRWGVSLFVQALDGGITESANVIETATGAVSLVNDCFFDVT